MKNRLDQLPSKAAAAKKAHKKTLQKLKNQKGNKVDELFQEVHEEVFEVTDCLECANCCKTTGPLFTDRDIERIARHLRMKPGAFIDQYLRIDEDKDYVLQQVPCPFLGSDNYCSIYDHRPKACREYPHTDRGRQSQLFSLALKNAAICPAVLDILEEIKQRVDRGNF